MKKQLIVGLTVAFALTITGAFAGLSAAKASAQSQALVYYNTAKELAAQGAIAYPVAFIDFSLWNDAVNVLRSTWLIDR